MGWGGLKYKNWNFDSIFFTDESLGDKEKFNLRKKSPKSDVYGLN
jgi:hypothetical protein